MKKVYYASKAIISTAYEFAVFCDDQKYDVSVSIALTMINHDKDLIYGHLYDSVKGLLGTDQFILIPSHHEVELRALQDDMMYHPEKYPNIGQSIGMFGGHDN
jgi:hypothetical protein